MFILIFLAFFNIRNTKPELVISENNLCQVPNVPNDLLPKNYSDIIHNILQKNNVKGERYYLSQEQFNKFKNKEIGLPVYNQNGFICKDKCVNHEGINQCINHKGNKVNCANYLEVVTGEKCDFSRSNNYQNLPTLSTCPLVRSYLFYTHPPILVTEDNKIFTCIFSYEPEDKELLNKEPITHDTTSTTQIATSITITIVIILIVLVAFYILYKKKSNNIHENNIHEVKTLIS